MFSSYFRWFQVAWVEFDACDLCQRGAFWRLWGVFFHAKIYLRRHLVSLHLHLPLLLTTDLIFALFAPEFSVQSLDAFFALLASCWCEIFVYLIIHSPCSWYTLSFQCPVCFFFSVLGVHLDIIFFIKYFYWYIENYLLSTLNFRNHLNVVEQESPLW